VPSLSPSRHQNSKRLEFANRTVRRSTQHRWWSAGAQRGHSESSPTPGGQAGAWAPEIRSTTGARQPASSLDAAPVCNTDAKCIQVTLLSWGAAGRASKMSHGIKARMLAIIPQ